MTNPTWLLPQGVTELLPEDAMGQEMLRRASIDRLVEQGFSLVSPPMMEFIDSLIQGAAQDMTTQTFKFPDYDTHRTLGFRADMTPQIAKIDAHRLADNNVNKLCYAGTVLRTQSASIGGPRELLQIGCEIFGDETTVADCQIIDAAMSLFDVADIEKPVVSLGHIGIYASLIESLGIEPEEAALIFDAVSRKSTPDIAALNAASEKDLTIFEELIKARGGQQVIADFRDSLQKSNVPVTTRCTEALEQLTAVSDHIAKNDYAVLHLDLSELHGYLYHTGLTFQFFVEGEGRAIAKGGRYLGVSKSTGAQADKPRYATGFSSDLNVLSRLS